MAPRIVRSASLSNISANLHLLCFLPFDHFVQPFPAALPRCRRRSSLRLPYAELASEQLRREKAILGRVLAGVEVARPRGDQRRLPVRLGQALEGLPDATEQIRPTAGSEAL